MSNVIDVQKLFKASGLEIFNGMRGIFDIKFDDGKVLKLNTHEIYLSRYLWELPKRHNISITSDFAISNFYEAGFFTGSTHKDYFSYVYRRIINNSKMVNEYVSFDTMEKAWEDMFNIVNLLYSDVQYQILEYGVSLSILDYIELQRVPELLDAIKAAKADKLNPAHVDTVNDIVRDVVRNNPKNNLAKLYNCGAANRTQISHSIGLRGFVTDINNMIYSELVGTNLTMGLDSFYDLACESAVMAKALKLQEFGVRYSEWLQRELHLVSMNIRNLIMDDCGNRSYKEWYIKDKNELNLLDGAVVLIDGKEVELDPAIHGHLVGNMIKTRRVNECKHLVKGNVCCKCLGSLSYTIPGHASTSHTFFTVLMAAVGQLMLSAKHYTESMVLKTLKLTPLAAKYLRLSESDYFIRDDLPKSTYHIVLNSDSYYGFRLLSSSMTNKINTLDTNKLSSVDKLYIKVTKPDGTSIREFIEIRQDGRSGILDQDFIVHSLINTSINTTGEYEIDVSNYRGRVLFLENKEFAFDQFNADFKTLLRSASKGKRVEPDKMINDIFNYLNKKLPINIKIVELLVAAITVNDKSKLDYSPGINEDTRGVLSYGDVILHRSPGIALGFEEQKNIINSPMNYIKGKLHPYNPLENVWNTKHIIWEKA